MGWGGPPGAPGLCLAIALKRLKATCGTSGYGSSCYRSARSAALPCDGLGWERAPCCKSRSCAPNYCYRSRACSHRKTLLLRVTRSVGGGIARKRCDARVKQRPLRAASIKDDDCDPRWPGDPLTTEPREHVHCNQHKPEVGRGGLSVRSATRVACGPYTRQ